MKKHLLILAICFSSISLFGQDMTLYSLRNAPQSIQLNPAFFPEHNWYAAIPVASSINVGATNTFALSDGLVTRDGSTYLDLQSLTDAIPNSGYLNVGTTLDIIDLGFKVNKRHFFTLTAQEVIDVKVAYNNGLVNLLRNGFADSSNIGTTVTITDFGPNIMHYSKMGIGYSTQLNDKMTLGVRPNVYFGKGYINTTDTEIGFFASNNLDQLLITADVNIKSGGLGILSDVLNFSDSTETSSSNGFDPAGYALNFKNMGYGIDFGITSQMDKTVTLSASVVDFGFIRWKNQALEHSISDVEINFTGLEDLGALAGGSDDENADPSDTTTFIDSFANAITDQLVVTESDQPFTTMLQTKIFLSGEWHLTEFMDLGFLIRSQLIAGKLNQALTVSSSFKVARSFNAAFSFTMANGSFDNLGVGLAYNAGPIQIYLVSDNLYGLAQLDYARQLNVRLGLNIRPKKPKEGRKKRKK